MARKVVYVWLLRSISGPAIEDPVWLKSGSTVVQSFGNFARFGEILSKHGWVLDM
ncbi:hypothetical protein BO94DRAFT_529811 [Aspergillus sclerotioniger CBS 115572]|uniref:Uncharacterized protein n=1 Tax=Aspergillus sclerotioniger CBS 115572 TaxID=1450535 RepID=A0A317XDL5_9EURO|nr:hypothetical protein BO94DRAFT_529811 [Aspergillus sclerotioniger CBS 115572]PWY96425.1 hypothetical protein BO94DRAFT_529811 [Aspergillus sclerotioniger CBS 115572]